MWTGVHTRLENSRSSQSIKIGKSDLIDIYCIDQSIEIDDALVSFVDQLSLVGVFSQLYYKYLTYAKKH